MLCGAQARSRSRVVLGASAAAIWLHGSLQLSRSRVRLSALPCAQGLRGQSPKVDTKSSVKLHNGMERFRFVFRFNFLVNYFNVLHKV